MQLGDDISSKIIVACSFIPAQHAAAIRVRAILALEIVLGTKLLSQRGDDVVLAPAVAAKRSEHLFVGRARASSTAASLFNDVLVITSHIRYYNILHIGYYDISVMKVGYILVIPTYRLLRQTVRRQIGYYSRLHIGLLRHIGSL